MEQKRETEIVTAKNLSYDISPIVFSEERIEFSIMGREQFIIHMEK